MLTVNTAAGHRGPVLVGHGVVKANAEEGMEHRERATAGNGRLERRERLSFGQGTGNKEGECLRKDRKLKKKKKTYPVSSFFKRKLKSNR